MRWILMISSSRPSSCLSSSEDVRTYYQRKFHYVMIDEYQDTNQLQYQLTALLGGGNENICVVGR